MNVIAVESFGGPDGPDLAIRIEDALRSARIEDRPYFRVLPGSAREADGVLRGTATAEITRERYAEQRSRCAAKDANGKCTERRKEDVRCFRRRIELVPNIRLIARDGALAYADNQSESVQDSRCDDDSSQFRSRETIVRGLADNIAARLRDALAPMQRRESIRVLEDRKGLSREDGEHFKNALRLTKSDPVAACRQWQAISAANANHAATIFNLGLCDEAAGDLDGAEQLYRRAAQLSPAGNIAGGLERIAARRRAARQLASHSAR
jgi:tetratricopeptide (TPR) repeat protein